MPKICYQPMKISEDRLKLISTCNTIIREYQADGLVLTLRQLFYQLVSRDVIPNTVKEYKRLGDVVNDARMAGLMDWAAIEDRTRNLNTQAHWSSPSDILEACASQFRMDRWANQEVYLEVWVEKEALAGVFERACRPLDVPFFCCRGYVSQSEMWGAAQRFVPHVKAGKSIVILHFGDHDPSGLDMSRDIRDRLTLFIEHHTSPDITIDRLALNMDQVLQYNPPENPAKTTDSRFASYAEQFGESSWELDALNPRTLNKLVLDNVLRHADADLFKETREGEAQARAILQTVADNWDHVDEKVREEFPDEFENNLDDARRTLNEGTDDESEEGTEE